MEIPGLEHMNQAKREAMEVAEEARETEWSHPSFVAELFMGRFRPDLLMPFPRQDPADQAAGVEFLDQLQSVLRDQLDPDQVDRTGELPADVVSSLADLGCFGIKISPEYGGLGMSQTNYNKAIMLTASHCASTAVWLSAHQSIGVPQPLKLFGTEEQKRKYLPRVARGEISAFALTEPHAGSDPARMTTTATPTDDGKHYIINGEKLWCTNGPVASIIVVMARTPSVTVNGREKQQITAFILETDTPGFEVVHRCQFMGLRGIQNGLLRFKDVKVPTENILWAPGRGLKLALVTLNTGRLTIPAACTGMAKRCLRIAREWSVTREQWGSPIGQHEVNGAKLARMAATTFAMEAVWTYAAGLADRGDTDLRLEAAMAKLFCSEASWQVVDETVQLRGGRGYETADSLAARGEEALPVERMMRDARINLIIEGTSEIMRLFIAREAMDAHMQLAAGALNSRASIGHRLGVALKAGAFYATWYPRQWVSWWPQAMDPDLDPSLARHLAYVRRTSHRLARSMFHAMGRHREQLEKRQLTLFRFVDIGMYLFTISATCAYAQTLSKCEPAPADAVALADIFCRIARRRIGVAFSELNHNEDRERVAINERLMEGQLLWLEAGILEEQR